MEITHKTEYALMMFAEMVRRPGEVISVRSVAEKKGIPYSFARSIQHDLVRAGSVGSVRGSRGGMTLSIDPSKVTLLQVVEAIQGPILTSSPFDSPSENHPFAVVFDGANALVREYLASVSLSDVVNGGKAPSLSPSYWAGYATGEALATA